MIRHLRKMEPLCWPLLACLLAAASAMFTYNLVDPDLWGHLRYGRDMIEQGRLFETDPYSYLSGGQRWVNHEVLSELLLGWLQSRCGTAGLVAWKWLMGLALLATLVYRHRHGRYRPVTVVAVAVLLVLNLWNGWVVRPQVFTFVLLSCLVLAAAEHERGRQWVLWLAVPLMGLWVNLHGGFLAGLAVLGVYVSARVGQAVWMMDQDWRRSAGGVTLVWLAAVAATMLNPYGPGLMAWLWESLSRPRPEIVEWWPVPLWSTDYMAFKLLVLVTAGSLAGSGRRRHWYAVVVLALAGWQALAHVRHIPLFAILAAHYVPEHLDSCLRRLLAWLRCQGSVRPAAPATVRLHAITMWGFAGSFALLAVWQARWLRVETGEYPVAAVRFIRQRGLRGRMVVDFNWGQYCIYALYPAIRVSADGRFRTAYPPEVLEMSFDFLLGEDPKKRWRYRLPGSRPARPDRLLDVGQPNLVLLDRRKRRCVKLMQARSDWVLLYQDELAQLWGRRSVYDDPSSPDYLPGRLRSIGQRPQRGFVPFPALF